MLELVPQKFIEPAIIISIFAILWLLGWGIKLAIEEPEHRSENKLVRIFLIIFEGVRNAVQFAGIIGLCLLYVAVLVVLPAYVVIHFVVKYW
jgi:hypothetical protein